jgi:hypothetical protein
MQKRYLESNPRIRSLSIVGIDFPNVPARIHATHTNIIRLPKKRASQSTDQAGCLPGYGESVFQANNVFLQSFSSGLYKLHNLIDGNGRLALCNSILSTVPSSLAQY